MPILLRCTFLLIFFLGLFVCVPSQTCTDYNHVITDFDPQTCFKDHLNYKAVNCLPTCQAFTSAKPPFCSRYYKSKTSIFVFQPSCDINGLFEPKQCKGEHATGRCFCSDSAGNRLFGQEWSDRSENMTCACSRRKEELRTLPADKRPYFISFHCNAQGNYEPLQCDVTSGQCWCVDEKTGELNSPVVPQAAMSKLPCGNFIDVGTTYLKQCESQAHAQALILSKFNQHGTTNVKFSLLLCDEDGAYGFYRIKDGLAYCTWRDNSNAGNWQSDASNGAALNALTCNCARDSIYFVNDGKTQNQKCDGNGNYKLYQTEDDTAYCVDPDGYRSKTTTPKAEDTCDTYKPA